MSRCRSREARSRRAFVRRWSRPSSRAPHKNMTATIAMATAQTVIRTIPKTVVPDIHASVACPRRWDTKARTCATPPPPQVWESALRRRQTEPSRLDMNTCSPKQRRVRRQRVRKTPRNPGERVRSPGSGVFPHSYSCSRSACGHGNVPETATGGASACSGRLQARSWCNSHLAWCSVFRLCIR